MIPIKAKRLHPDAVIPKYATPGAAGFDLVAVEDVIIEPGETKLVKTGLAFEIPAGYEIQIRPRSGMSLKTKLRISNAPGTIDADYRGEVCVIVDNAKQENGRFFEGVINAEGNPICHIDDTKEGTYIIRKGDRIAQGVLAKAPQAVFVEVDELGETARGEGGFGSTGTSDKGEWA